MTHYLLNTNSNDSRFLIRNHEHWKKVKQEFLRAKKRIVNQEYYAQ